MSEFLQYLPEFPSLSSVVTKGPHQGRASTDLMPTLFDAKKSTADEYNEETKNSDAVTIWKCPDFHPTQQTFGVTTTELLSSASSPAPVAVGQG